MPTLRFVVDRNGFLTIQPPIIPGVVVCCLDFQNGSSTIWELNKVVYICQHPWIFRVLEHLFNLVDFITCFAFKNLCHQGFQQMSHFQRDPITFLIFNCRNIQLVVIQVPGCPPWGNPQKGCHITSANAAATIREPFFLCKTSCINQHQRFQPLFSSRVNDRHGSAPPPCLTGNDVRFHYRAAALNGVLLS